MPREWYVVVAARRIQPWLARTPRLAMLRGGSHALQEVTAPAKVTAALDTQLTALGAIVSGDDSAVDGVVVAKAPNEATAAEVAKLVLGHVRAQLPGVEWHAWWARADSYVAAYETRPRDPAPAALPAVEGIPGAKSCETCRGEPAVATIQLPDTGPDRKPTQRAALVGTDCQTRWTHTRDLKQKSLTFDHLARRGGSVRGEPDQQALGRRDSSNHLATICADGNRMGAFFDAVAKAGPEWVAFRASAITLLNEKLKSAVEDALATLSQGSDRSVGIIHYVGGDDVLVSVVANRAWEFCELLGSAFEDFRVELRKRVPQGIGAPDDGEAMAPPGGVVDGQVPATGVETAKGEDTAKAEGSVANSGDDVLAAIDNLSLGIGVVFAHASHPFATCQQIAHDDALKAAKKATNGTKSAAAWADLTEGTAPDAERCLTIEELRSLLRDTRYHGAPGVLRLNSSARGTLADLVKSHPDVGARGNALATWVRRTRRREELGADWQIDAPDLVAQRLSLARWWPLAPPPPGTKKEAG